jgi:hypothetical protein
MAGRTCDHLRSVFGDCSVNGSLTSARHPSSTQGRFGTGVGVTLGLQSDSTLNIGRLNGCCLTYAVDQRFEPNEELAESRDVSSLPGPRTPPSLSERWHPPAVWFALGGTTSPARPRSGVCRRYRFEVLPNEGRAWLYPRWTFGCNAAPVAE